MLEDIDIGKLCEGLDQIPGLIENAKRQDLRDKANAEKFKEIKDYVSDMKTELSSLKTSIDSAKNEMQKEVNVIYPPIPDVKIKHSDFTVYAEHTDAEIEKVAETVAEKVFKKKSTSNFYTKFAEILIVMCCAIIGVFSIKQNNDYRSWMDRAISIGVIAGDMHPGDRAISVKEEFKKGHKARKAKKAEIKVWEEKYNKKWQNNARVFKNAISGVIEKDVVILDFNYADVDSTSYNALVIFRLEDSEVETRAHICRDGNIYLTQDTDINSVQEADKYFGRKSWHLIGNRFDNDK